jgi:hypothetical protein
MTAGEEGCDIIRRMGIRRYVDEYEAVTQKDEQGRERTKLVYQGAYFAVTFSQGEIASYRSRAMLSLVISIAFHVSAGFINNPGMRRAFISIPYIAAYLPFYYLAAGILSLPKEERLLQRDEVELSFTRIKRASGFLSLAISSVLVGELAFLLFSPPSDIVRGEFVFLGLEFIAGAAALMFTIFQKKITITKEKP